jgi:hypothetical protein
MTTLLEPLGRIILPGWRILPRERCPEGSGILGRVKKRIFREWYHQSRWEILSLIDPWRRLLCRTDPIRVFNQHPLEK